MASALVTAFLTAKLYAPQESKALYAVAGDRGGAEQAARAHARIVAANVCAALSRPTHFNGCVSGAGGLASMCVEAPTVPALRIDRAVPGSYR